MDVHDVGSYAGPLAPGMVLTIEPGLYLPEEGIGIRIEDDVLVTADGREVLSAAIPRAPDAVERAMRSRVP
jgi:Xaa-Pro aminopeptidase